MPFLTVPEFYDTRLYELDDANFKRLERVFRRILGDKARRFLNEHMCMTVAQLSATNVVDVMSAICVL